MKRIWLTLIAAGMLAIAAFAPVSAQDSVTLDLEGVEESGVAGNVRIESENGESTVTILLTQGLEDASVHPVHIHEGTCDDLGDVAYPLNNIEDGSSETTIDVDLSELRTGAFAINAHESEENISTFIACADIPAAVGGDVEGDDGDESDEADDSASEDDDATDDDGASDDDAASEDDGSDDEGSMDESEDDAADESDDGAAEDDGSADEGDEGTDDSADDGSEDDAADDADGESADDSTDDASEDESADDSDDQDEEDDAAEDDGEDEEQEEVAPATGSTGGIGPDTAAMTLMLLAGGGLVAGMLLRRRASQVQRS